MRRPKRTTEPTPPAPGDAITRSTYYNRSQAARILGVNRRSLYRFEEISGLSLFAPCRRGGPLLQDPQYHARQVELIDQALADQDNLKRYDEVWQTIKKALGTITMNEAEDLGLIKEGKHVA